MTRLTNIFICLWLMLIAFPARAMDVSVAGNMVTLSGPVVNGDLKRLTDALSAQPEIKTVMLRNSNGGDAPSGYRIGELIRKRGLTTVVSGHCISSCSRMFMGGRERRFSDDQGLEKTFVAFHGHYDRNGNLNRHEVERLGLYDWIIKFSDGKADKELVRRWVNIEYNRGMVAFMHPDTKIAGEARTFICDGRELRRPLGCEGLAVKALALGVITDLTIWRSSELN